MNNEDIMRQVAGVKNDLAELKGSFSVHAQAAAETRDDIRAIKDRLAQGENMFGEVRTLISETKSAITAILTMQQNQADRMSAIEKEATLVKGERAGQSKALRAIREWAPIAVLVVGGIVTLFLTGKLHI